MLLRTKEEWYTNIAPMKYKSDHVDEKIWRCDCGGDHFLSVSLWKWEYKKGSYDGYIEIADDSVPIPGNGWWSLKERLKGAWYVLRGRRHTWAVILLSPKTCQEIIDRLTKVKKELEEHGGEAEKHDT